MTSNRRQFSRIQFQTEARLYLPAGESAVELLDLSLNGALIQPSPDFYAKVGTKGSLKIRLDDMGTLISMDVAIVHHQGDVYGLACREIDLDSVTHLRQLVALNTGDEALLERELALLIKS